MGALSELEPKRVFKFFEEIESIPRGAGNMEKIVSYMEEFAKVRGISCEKDDYNNVIMKVDGSNGYEDHEPFMLQTHMDMFCSKGEGPGYDFLHTPVKLHLDETHISAEGTSLGGAEGIGMAACLAVLDAEDIPHPPLEVVFTSDERPGMMGAMNLDTSSLRSKMMLNIASNGEGKLYAACAGGLDVICTLPVVRQEHEGFLVRIKVHGLYGGHSGLHIDRGRANAIMVLAYQMYRLFQEVTFYIADIEGGYMENTIPDEAAAYLIMRTKQDAYDAIDFIRDFSKKVLHVYRVSDPDISVDIDYIGEDNEVKFSLPPLDKHSTEKLIDALITLPNGIERMSPDVMGLVESSLNLGILRLDKTSAEVRYSVRSAIEYRKVSILDQLKVAMKTFGGMAEGVVDIPIWYYKEDSKLQEVMLRVYERKYGKIPKFMAVHAGLESSVFAERIEGMDAISLGPEVRDISTPRESLEIGSVGKMWELLLEVLKEL